MIFGIAPDALRASTDYPDEAAYLQKVRNTLEAKGVWLRIGPKLVHDREDPSRHVVDPRAFEVFLSLGPDGDSIPTASGQLTREALLATTMLGAGYYESVHQGAIQTALDKEIKRLWSAIETGEAKHAEIAAIRRNALIGVVKYADALGDASYPDQSIWNGPRQFVLRALQLNVGGNVNESHALLFAAAFYTENAVKLLKDYIAATTEGAAKMLPILHVLETVGKGAEFILSVASLVGIVRAATGVVRASVRASAANASAVSPSARQAIYRLKLARAREVAEERMVQAAQYVRPGAVRAAERQHLLGWKSEFDAELRAATPVFTNGFAGTYVTMDKFMPIVKRLNKKWGSLLNVEPY